MGIVFGKERCILSTNYIYNYIKLHEMKTEIFNPQQYFLGDSSASFRISIASHECKDIIAALPDLDVASFQPQHIDTRKPFIDDDVVRFLKDNHLHAIPDIFRQVHAIMQDSDSQRDGCVHIWMYMDIQKGWRKHIVLLWDTKTKTFLLDTFLPYGWRWIYTFYLY